MRELAAQMIASEVSVVRIESANDPLPQPRGDGGVVVVQCFLEVTRGAGVLQRLDVARDDLRQHPHARAIDSIARNQPVIGKDFIEVFDDGERLREPLAIVDERGHTALRIDLAIGGGELIAAFVHEVDGMQRVRQRLEIESDAYAI